MPIESAMKLASAFVTSPPLKYLDLSGNNLGTKGLKLIVEGVKSLPKLKTLIVNQNSICSEGGFALATLINQT